MARAAAQPSVRAHPQAHPPPALAPRSQNLLGNFSVWYNSDAGWALCARHVVPANSPTPRDSVISLPCAYQALGSGVAVVKNRPGVLSLAEVSLFGYAA